MVTGTLTDGKQASLLKHKSRGLDRACQRQDIDPRGAAPLQHPRAGLRRGAGGDDVIHEDDLSAFDRRPAWRRDLEGARDIALTLLGREPDLARRPPHLSTKQSTGTPLSRDTPWASMAD